MRSRIDEIISIVNQFEQPVTFLGDGVPVFQEYIAENCSVPYTFAPAHVNKQRAGAVAALGMKYFAEADQKRCGTQAGISAPVPGRENEKRAD